MGNRGDLLVVSHVMHYEWEGKVWAYTPYMAELDLWADLFSKVTVASPTLREPPPLDCAAGTRTNIAMVPMAETGGQSALKKLLQLLVVPLLAARLFRLMRRADVIHARCPGNLGLLCVAIAPLTGRNRIAKYAGQWGAYPGEAGTYRLQRFLLRSRWWSAPVTVYGKSPGDPDHVIDFFSAALSDAQVKEGGQLAQERRRGAPIRVLFVGRLTKSKNADVLIEAVTTLLDEGCDVRLNIVGEGPEEERLRDLVSRSAHADRFTFSGSLPVGGVLKAYSSADVLVLVSETEGFPKAAVEAMAYGLVVVGSNRGHLKTILDEGRGLLVEAGDKHGVSEALRDIANRPSHYDEVGRVAASWAACYSLEGLRTGISDIMTDAWG